jgi:flavin-dependent dehydrogenase
VIIIKIDIVGGSISGINTAISLKKHDKSINVIIHEKHKTIGYNFEGRRCGEAHSIESEWKKWKPEKDSIFNHITEIETTFGKKQHIFHRKPGKACILNRQKFICQLAKEAEKLGVNIQTSDKIKTIRDLDGDYIVDASGCPSSIKKELGLNKGIKGISYQQTLEKSNCFNPNKMKIIITGDFGYYWIFPRNPLKNEINLGIGIFGRYNYNLKNMLEKFKIKQNIKGKINHVTGGLLPLGLQKPLIYKNILFVGDSGVGTYPLTGQGIYRALISGDIAGECIAKKYPKKYPYIINQKFIKWDVICKAFIIANRNLKRLNHKLVLTSMYYFLTFLNAIH